MVWICDKLHHHWCWQLLKFTKQITECCTTTKQQKQKEVVCITENIFKYATIAEIIFWKFQDFSRSLIHQKVKRYVISSIKYCNRVVSRVAKGIKTYDFTKIGKIAGDRRQGLIQSPFQKSNFGTSCQKFRKSR